MFSFFTQQGTARKMQQPVVAPGQTAQGCDHRTSGELFPSIINKYLLGN